MPIIHFANSKNQTSGGLKRLLGYVSREKKTKLEDRRFVSGVNCSTENAYNEMMLTKQMHKKTGGRLYYHLVQSFPKGYDIKPELAHKIALELTGKALKDYECVVATHIDREHIHSHIVFNSVSFDDGRKYHSDNNSLHELMKLSDEICRQYGVAVLDKPKFGKENQNDVLGDKEYRSAVRGESFKFALMNAITDCMKQAKSKKQFIALMKRKGYYVRWEQQRKYITYTTPKGKKCRCNKLHDRRFTKEMMEYEFKIRYAIFNGEEQGQYAAGGRDIANGGSAGAELDGGAEEVREELKELPTGKQMTRYEQNQSILLGRYQQESEQNRQQIRQEMKEMSSELLKQAGSLNVEYSSKLKEQENWRQKLSSRLFKILIASHLIQLILLTGLLLWLR